MVRSCKFESHPGICLKDHLRLVGSACESKALSITGDPSLSYIAKIIGLTHDFGKYTEYFQDHLYNKRKHNRDLTSHAPLSSLYTAWLLDRNNMDPFITATGMLCVLSHHGSISKCLTHLNELIRDYLNNNNHCRQIDSLRKNAMIISEELKEIGLQPIEQFLDDIRADGLKEIRKKLFELNTIENNEIKAFERLYTILLLFSVLIDSDKKITAAVDEPDRQEIDIRSVEEHIKILSRRGDRLTGLRASIREDVLTRLDMIRSNPPHILSINAPTGSGKTLLALTTALLLREDMKRTTGKLYRIIYVLPYINIIEQTYSVLSSILTDGREDISILLKHHHIYFPEYNGERSNDERLMLVESWDSEIIVTTLVQFMETLLGTDNRMLKKFHKLYNSIIILDEIQTVPVEYWLLLRKSLVALSDHSYIIFMTATRPSIFSENEYTELLVNSRHYFQQLNRVRYIVHNNIMGIDEMKELIINIWSNSNSVLVIVNKISTSIELYSKIKDSLPDLIYVGRVENEEEPDSNHSKPSFSVYTPDMRRICWREIDRPVVIYLSTNIIPKERLNRILLINRLIKERKKILVISTQLVEAGVDLDFDTVVRDIGPLDSIIQAAGRCNRNWNREMGIVHITKLRSMRDKNRLDAVDIYGALTVNITENVLNDKEEFEESDVFDMIEQYYRLINTRLNAERSALSVKYIDAIKRLDLDFLLDFKVIRDRPTVPVFIEIDDNATQVLTDFREVLNIGGRDYTAMVKKRKARARLEEYIVESYDKDNLPQSTIASEIDYIRYVSAEKISEYYNYDTGLRRERYRDESYLIL